MSPEVRKVSWELSSYVRSKPPGEVKLLAHNVWANLSVLDRDRDVPAFRAVMAEKIARWEEAIRRTHAASMPGH